MHNRQFQSVFSLRSPLDLAQLCQSAVCDSISLFGNLIPDRYSTMPELEISIKGVAKLLSSLNIVKSAGPDEIKPVVLKELSPVIAPAIAAILQTSLDQGAIPEEFKKAQVCPLFKKGDTSNPANYCPVSLTCILCKTLEHIIASSLTKHFGKHNILYDLQHGFRERRSCETQLIQLEEDLAQNSTSGIQTDLILLDFSKAFNKVSHLKLLYKLQMHGIEGNTLRWIRPFLIERSQTVVLEGVGSKSYQSHQAFPRDPCWGLFCFCCI